MKQSNAVYYKAMHFLFSQPPPNEDCPICFLPLPSSISATSYQSCCGNNICNGCIYGFVKSAADKIDPTCPFCRSIINVDDDEVIEQIKKRIDAGDKEAIYQLGRGYEKGHCGLPRDEKKALALYEKAGELGVVSAYTNIGYFYLRGQVVERDAQKAEECFGRAAIGGNIDGRWNLGLMEEFEYNNMHRASKHYRISAMCGDSASLEKIRDFYRYGYATKDEYAEALVSYQSYLALTRSEQRDKAAVFTEMLLGGSK